MKSRRIALWSVLAALLIVLAYNASLTVPVASKLAEDSRNRGVELYAYRTWALSPNGLTLDLVSVDGQKAPVDLFRALFQSAQALKGRHFSTVTLARRGKPVFMIAGTDFEELGVSFDEGENPIYLIRTLPEKLFRVNGVPAFGHWEGGLLGVLGKQMEDVNTFARDWITS